MTNECIILIIKLQLIRYSPTRWTMVFQSTGGASVLNDQGLSECVVC